MNSLKNMVKKEEEIDVIASIYARNLHILVNSKYPYTISNSFLYIHRVDEALSSLDERQRELINNDFFNPVNPLWWKSIYSGKVYLSVRYSAVGSFLRHFYGLSS